MWCWLFFFLSDKITFNDTFKNINRNLKQYITIYITIYIYISKKITIIHIRKVSKNLNIWQCIVYVLIEHWSYDCKIVVQKGTLLLFASIYKFWYE